MAMMLNQKHLTKRKKLEMIEVERLNGINNRSDVENRKKIFNELLIANYPIKEVHERRSN